MSVQLPTRFPSIYRASIKAVLAVRKWGISSTFLTCALSFAAPSLLCADGTVARTTGDLVYISGFNADVPLWSTLHIGTGISAEVIKELPNILVARLTATNNRDIRPGDPVSVVERGAPTTERRAKRIVRATRVDTAPRIDGKLDDAAWSKTSAITGFVQRDPEYWMPGEENTVARIAYDDEHIYFAFDCPIPDASGPVANNMRRDADLTGDDNIQIMLDTFNDGQNGVFFFVNPLGARTDLILSNEGRTDNSDWDSNWTARTTQSAQRWTAEVAIPFSQLRFKPADEMVWGINLSRFNAKKNVATQLVVGTQSSSRSARYSMAEMGVLHGLNQISTRTAIEIKPYILPGASKDFLAANAGEDLSFDAGADLHYGITSNLSLDVSYKTDFAQVEADQEQTNLAQFSLFFPEKREFFLEGSNLFAFGDTDSRGSRRPTLLFYSRRIGLEDDHMIPILLGAKLTGKQGRTSIGALNAITDPTSYIDDDGNSVEVERTNYSVMRLKRDVMARSNVGLILVNKQADNARASGDSYQRAGGIDFSYSPSSELNLQGFLARTWTSETDSDNAGFLYLDYRGSKYWARAKYYDIGERFEPAVGFVNRRGDLEGLRRYYFFARWRPRPELKGVRQISTGPEVDIFTDRSNEVKYWNSKFSLFTDFESGDQWRSELEHTYDVVDEAFSPSDRHPEVMIPPGSYHFTSFSTGPRPSSKRRLVPEISLEAGTYYSGNRYTIKTETAFRPSGRTALELIYEANWIQLPQAEAKTNTVHFGIHALSTRLLYSFTTDFFVKFFATWNNDEQSVGTNVLLNYQYRPGSDLFIVIDNGFDTISGLNRRHRSALLKLSYQLDL